MSSKAEVALCFCFSFKSNVYVCVRALRHCEEMIQRYSRDASRSSSGSSQPHCSVGKAVQDCMRAVIGVLLNLTHDNGELETMTWGKGGGG